MKYVDKEKRKRRENKKKKFMMRSMPFYRFLFEKSTLPTG
ncbi:hypothetical protein SBY92_000953 [Candida maltosa Xu316]